jgi:hypothetical protein
VGRIIRARVTDEAHVRAKEEDMAGRGEALAKKFEAKADEATAVFEKLSDAD